MLCDSGLQQGQVHIVAAVQGHISDFLIVHQSAQGAAERSAPWSPLSGLNVSSMLSNCSKRRARAGGNAIDTRDRISQTSGPPETNLEVGFLPPAIFPFDFQ